jgi:mono/diheme cytochrome c family protein
MRILLGFVLLCSMAASQEAYSLDASWHVPKEAASLPSPLANRLKLVPGGERLFHRHCAECHGDRGEGGRRKQATDLRNKQVQAQPDGALFWKITNGNENMPQWSRLPEAQRWQIELFLRTLETP